LLKQTGLTHFAGKIEAGVIVGEDMRTMPATQSVKGLTAPLRDDDRVGPGDGSPIFIVRHAARAKNILVGYDVWMKRQNHINPIVVSDE
jgi:hypothetical protein